MTDSEDDLTYAKAGVDIDASEAATAALVDVIGDVETADYAGLLSFGDHYLALATDGVGTKLLVAEAIDDYRTIGIDCIAMNVNDLVAMGVTPLGFVDYLAVDEPDEELTAALGEGLATGAEIANIQLLGGETAVLPEIVSGFDLAGACVGAAREEELLSGTAEPGDRLVGFASNGIHSNGLTLARQAVTRRHDYQDLFPPNPQQTIGEVLLEPTAIYTDLLELMHGHDVHAAAHITGGGWTNLERLGDHRYVIDDPLPVQPVFEFIRDEGNVSTAEMHRTFNMGTGFVIAAAPTVARELSDESDGRVIGHVEEGSGIQIRGEELAGVD